MKRQTLRLQLSNHDRKILTLPATVIALMISAVMLVQGLNFALPAARRTAYLFIGAASIFYIVILFRLVLPLLDRYPILHWIIVLVNGISTGILFTAEPGEPVLLPLIFCIIVIVISAIISGRLPTYLFIFVSMVVLSGLIVRSTLVFRPFILELATIPLLGIIITETILRLQRALHVELKRLRTLNNVARSLATSLETPQVLSLLSSAIQNSFQADTYYMGILKGETLHLELFYDDGEFFPQVDLQLENTMAGWAIHHHQSLLVRNFDKESSRLGIDSVIVGKSKGSLSWMGTPITSGGDQLGLVAVASYQKNAFRQADLELLENIAQQAALAIDNTYHHAEVEQQSQIDSLTGAYNHGYFLKLLEKEAKLAIENNNSLSLIMLDIDYFKHYNDQYGHLAGDEILSLLTNNIRKHIHLSDIVGRWGGEEFAVLLPNTTGKQAAQVAERIRQSMNTFILSRRDQKSIPSPTVSQGIAVFPDEASEIYNLIDLADQRLYVAKERGRNQIETAPELIASIQMAIIPVVE